MVKKNKKSIGLKPEVFFKPQIWKNNPKGLGIKLNLSNKNSEEDDSEENNSEESEKSEELEGIIEQFIPNLNLEQISPVLEPIGQNLELNVRRVITDKDEEQPSGIYELQNRDNEARTNPETYEMDYHSKYQQSSESQEKMITGRDVFFQRDDFSRGFREPMKEPMQRGYETERDKRLREDRRR